MEPTFTFAKQTDLPKIVSIYNQNITTRQATADLEPVTVDERMPWFLGHNEKTRPLWLIHVGDEIAGWISLTDFYGRVAYHKTVEVSIYIDQAYQGKHLGQKAIEQVEKQVKSLGVETVLAYIFGHNAPSLALFEKFGYKRWAHLPAVAEMDGVKRDLDILGKKYES